MNMTWKCLTPEILQRLSDRYVARARKAKTAEQKKRYYNKVLLYSGLKAVVEEK